jgi:aminoglycoside phosphotransferase (APT) family kinase protein
MVSIDLPGEVKPDQSLDVTRLSNYLRRVLPALSGEFELLQFPSGHSNLTYLLRIGGRELVLKREPSGSKAKSAHDMGREFLMLSKLHGKYPFAPEAIHYCEDTSVTGGKFCVMERISGVIIRRDYPTDTDDKAIQSQYRTLVQGLAALHSLNVADVGLDQFGRPESYRTRQIEGWIKRLTDAATPDMPDFGEITSWLARNSPERPQDVAVIHNDFKMDNLVWSGADITTLIGVLDWEMATVGDPLMDLACSLSFWVQESDPPEFRSLRAMPSVGHGVISRAEAVDLYSRLTNRVVRSASFYLCYGLFRRAVIEQQKYARFLRGQTSDSRFSGLNKAIEVIKDMCLDTIQAK